MSTDIEARLANCIDEDAEGNYFVNLDKVRDVVKTSNLALLEELEGKAGVVQARYEGEEFPVALEAVPLDVIHSIKERIGGKDV